ncbi:hypothetical protein G1K75_09490 [Tenacibaculum finnmarkense]|uniref:hypothetical protein n=1 Tax=Tenacibaculum finnmarkense TaxID=2781243 RepID=UPI001E3FA714|nr:hypothetical protein [Tenacibaculum finnmarkense]MCD8405802.1 hypothetical protein [Tenacibaculum dicentrarchi]MCG8805888.1 hypothetical protein [Tenacibaculum finnmarkense]MCG8838604.1 hypothetical protein [Tenacibaculum dicentrarchi]
MLNQLKTLRENQAKIPLYKSLTSMRSLAVSIQSYNIFYGIKQASFFYLLFEYLIPNDYLRVIPALFFGYFVAKAMLNIAVNIPEKKEWVIVSIAFFDFLMLCVIVDIMHKTDTTEITNNLIFCGFVTYIGYWLNHVFVVKVEKIEKAESEQKQTELEQVIAELELVKIEKFILEQKRTESEQVIAELEHRSIAFEKTETELEHNRPYTDHVRPDADHVRLYTDQVKAGNQTNLLDSINKTCPYCKRVYPSKRSRDSHKGKCKMNPKNIK